MTRDEEDMMLRLFEASAQNDISQSERFASEAKMKQAFVSMYRAKSQECDQKNSRIEELERRLAEHEAKTLPPQQVTNNFFNGEVKQIVSHLDQQTIQTTDTNERTDN